MFDNKIFLYLEEIDLCKRLIQNNHKIFYVKKQKFCTKVQNRLILALNLKNVEIGIGCGLIFIFKKNILIISMLFLNYLPTAILYFLKTIIYFIIFKR